MCVFTVSVSLLLRCSGYTVTHRRKCDISGRVSVCVFNAFLRGRQVLTLMINVYNVFTLYIFMPEQSAVKLLLTQNKKQTMLDA